MAQVKLSVEEVGYAMSMVGGPELAAGFLTVVLGELSPLELEGRLYAASHSLIARGLLDIDLEAGTQNLEASVRSAVAAIARNRFSIRCSRSSGEDEELLSYFVSDSAVVEHRLEQQVVSCLEMVQDTPSAVSRCAAFFGIASETKPEPMPIPVGTVPAMLLEDTKTALPEITAEEIVTRLVDGGLPQKAATEMAEDLVQHEYRGSILQVQPSSEEALLEVGFLLLKGPQRLWIIEIESEDPPLAQVHRASEGTLVDVIAGLFDQAPDDAS